MTNDTWGAVRDQIRKSVGNNNYTAWIEPLGFERLDGSVLRLVAPTNFIGSWVTQNYADVILRHCTAAGVRADRLECIVANTAAAPAPRAAIAPEPAVVRKPAVAVNADLPGAALDPRFTFDAFVVGKPNELAHASARRVAAGNAVGFNPLFLYGGVGLGKTHLMQAIAWELQASQPHLRVLYLSAEQFMYRFIQALREKDTISFKQLFRSVDVLMVDDVQFIAGKESTQDEFFHTFNALIDQGKQIVISADRSPADITDLEERIRSRLQSGLVVDLHPADFELRLGVLQHKMAQFRAQNPDLAVAPGVLEFLADRISSNIRVLEGAVTRLFAFSTLVGGEITLDRAQDCLADILRASERKLTIDEIMKQVCEHYNLRMSDMVSARRTRSIARPRQMAMYLAKKLTPRSYPEIGRKFGGRDHTTVLHGVRKIEELITQDSQVAEDALLLERKLES